MADLNRYAKMRITSIDEARRFDAYLAAYEMKKVQLALPYLPLEVAFQKFPPTERDGRLFYALLDLKISVVLLFHDMWEVGHAWNQAYTTGDDRRRGALESEENFGAKMAFHAPLNSFVLRYRAVWDKIFSIMVLMLALEKYQAFRNTKKGRKKAFLQAVGDHPSVSRPKLEFIVADLERFEATFRTPEIHDTGSIRTWSFTIAELSGSPHEMLVGYWNKLVYTIDWLTKYVINA